MILFFGNLVILVLNISSKMAFEHTMEKLFYGVAFEVLYDDGGFQLEFVSISRNINHMASYNLSDIIG